MAFLDRARNMAFPYDPRERYREVQDAARKKQEALSKFVRLADDGRARARSKMSLAGRMASTPRDVLLRARVQYEQAKSGTIPEGMTESAVAELQRILSDPAKMDAFERSINANIESSTPAAAEGFRPDGRRKLAISMPWRDRAGRPGAVRA